MNSSETDVKEFLKKIAQSVFLGLFWMLLNMTVGIFFGWMFVSGGITTANIIYYLFFTSSLAALIWFYVKTWKKKYPHG